VEALARAGYVDDARFAHGRAAALARRGAGDALIREDLERQGVPREAAEAALAALEPERVRAERVAAARGRTPRTLRFLAAKGFAEESLEPLVADSERGTVG
jgi:SOS response regulatory protein OraA/RecX